MRGSELEMMHLHSIHNRDTEDVQSDAMVMCCMSCLLSLIDTDLCKIFVNNFFCWSTYHSNYTQIRGKVVSGV